jgi:hypothetical protein
LPLFRQLFIRPYQQSFLRTLIAMNLRLYILKRDDASDYSRGHYIRFAVVDLDKSKKYPSNFVCILPKQFSGKNKQSNVFARVFGKDSLGLAMRLLNEALETEDDREIKGEIEKRLKLLGLKPVGQVKCRVCGNFFSPTRYKQKTCRECKMKTLSGHE